MKTYFIEYKLITYQYMESGSSSKNSKLKTIMVEANDESKAEETLVKYWENKSDSFSTNYRVDDICVAPMIRQSEIL